MGKYVKCRTCDRKAPQKKRSSCRDCSNTERKCRTPKCSKDHDGKPGKLCSKCRRPKSPKCQRCNTNDRDGKADKLCSKCRRPKSLKCQRCTKPASPNAKDKLCDTCWKNKCGKCNNNHDGNAGKLCSKCRPRKKPKQPCRKCKKTCNGRCVQCRDCGKWQFGFRCAKCKVIKDAKWEANKKAMMEPLATFAPIKLGGNPVNSAAAWKRKNGRSMRTNLGTNENPNVVSVDMPEYMTPGQAHALGRYFGGKFRRRLADTSIPEEPEATYRCCVSEDIPMTRQRRLMLRLLKAEES